MMSRMALMVVVLPAPFSPMKPIIIPLGKVNEIFLSSKLSYFLHKLVISKMFSIIIYPPRIKYLARYSSYTSVTHLTFSTLNANLYALRNMDVLQYNIINITPDTTAAVTPFINKPYMPLIDINVVQTYAATQTGIAKTKYTNWRPKN